MKTSRDDNSVVDPVPEQRRSSRLLFLVLPLGLGLMLVIAAVAGLVSGTASEPSTPEAQTPVLTTVEAASVPPTATLQVQAEAAGQPAPTQVATPAADVVAQVNGQIIDREVLQAMQASDRAMIELLGGTSPSGNDVLDRLVNGELVWQAAQVAGFALDQDRIDQQLQDFLAAKGKSMAELEPALAANAVSVDDFKTYFRRLVLIDQFSQAQAQTHGVTVSEYLRQLQQEARISFGPAAEEALAQSVNAPQAMPSKEQATPTQVAGSDSPESSTEVVAETPTTAPADVPRGTGTGQYAPLFDLPVLNYPAADFLTLGDLAGKPTLLSFWTTWCPYCRAQTPVLVDAQARYGESVQFVGINVKENQQTVQNYVNSNDMRYPIALDFDGRVAGRYGVAGFPTTYFLDAEGRIVARHVGQLSSEKAEDYLQQLLTAGGP